MAGRKTGLPGEVWRAVFRETAHYCKAHKAEYGTYQHCMSVKLKDKEWIAEVLRKLGYEEYASKILAGA